MFGGLGASDGVLPHSQSSVVIHIHWVCWPCKDDVCSIQQNSAVMYYSVLLTVKFADTTTQKLSHTVE